jgi:hypothetical protein
MNLAGSGSNQARGTNRALCVTIKKSTTDLLIWRMHETTLALDTAALFDPDDSRFC